MPVLTTSSVPQLPTVNSLEISRFQVSLKGVGLGEILPATVLEKSAGNKYLVSLKNMNLQATSNIPLNVGDKLTVQVQSLKPQIILNVVENKNSRGGFNFDEILRQWRANPESLLQVLNNAAQLAKLAQTGQWPAPLAPNDAVRLLQLFDSIVFSSRTKNNSLFLKDFVSKTGLLLEHTIRQFVSDAAKGVMGKQLEDNLKSLLLKLSSSVQQALQEKSGQATETTAKLLNIYKFTEEALKTLETKQVLNSVFQDSDNGLVLQVPLALGDGFRLADIFITADKNDKQGGKKFSSCSIYIFLDLDILGKIAVNAGVREEGFRCIIKCESEEVRDLIDGQIAGLKNSLEATGYRVDHLDCRLEEGLERQRDEFLAEQSFSGVDLVNFFV